MFEPAEVAQAPASGIHVTVRIKCDGFSFYTTLQLFTQIV